MASARVERSSMGSSDFDPFATLLAPPQNETPQERERRLLLEAEAKRISDDIDEYLAKEKHQLAKKESKGVKILLLGQSESGKSTLQRQFTLLHAGPNAFDGDRTSWRLVVFLNVVRSLQKILNTLKLAVADPDDDIDVPVLSSLIIPDDVEAPADPKAFVAELNLRLAPVLSLEGNIIERLLGPAAANGTRVGGILRNGSLNGVLESENEFFIRPDSGPSNRLFSRLRQVFHHDNQSKSSGIEIDWEEKGEPGRMMHQCGGDMIALWNHPWTRAVLRAMKIRVEESAGFFLDDLPRIVQPRYMPTDDDILRARIKTVGVSEHVLPSTAGEIEWRIYDVGGTRTQRHAWVPYFDSVNAVIFLAPLSPFDTPLTEDKKVNALEDSLLIWRELCSNKILSKVPLVLFLNKADLLRKKLQDGVSVKKYVVSYGDRPNEYENVERYFRAKFDIIRKQHSGTDRPVFVHVTTCINQKTTTSIIANVQELLLRDNLKSSALM